MSFWNNVNQHTVSQASDGFSEFAIGDNEAFIDKVEEKFSESGNEMLVITFAKTGSAETKIKYYIVDGEWKMSKLKQLYIAFNIPIGETETSKWLGKTGIVVCKQGKPYNGNIRNEVNYLRPKPGANANKAQHSQPTAQQSGQQPNQEYDPSEKEFDDDIPF